MNSINYSFRLSRRIPAIVVCIFTMTIGILTRPGAADGVGTGLTIQDKPMPDTSSKARPAGTTVDIVVLHFSSDVIGHPDDPFQVDKVIQIYKDSDSSAHYLIDRTGNIYRLVSEDRQAFHAGKGKLPWEPSRENTLNASSIGIEMLAIGSKTDMTKMHIMTAAAYDQYKQNHPDNIGFTTAEYDALNKLLADIKSRRPEIINDRRHIIGHDDYASDRRSDPGELFDWSKIGLQPKP